MNAHKLSACIVCCNEKNNIADCLKSVSFADEIIVVDSFSADNTVEIARQFTDNVFQQEYLGQVGQKNFAISKARGEWIFSIDADERVTEDLRKKITEIISAPSPANGYLFPRKNYFLGKWMRCGGWYPDHVLRLFRNGKGKFGGVDPHDRAIIEGQVQTLPLPIIHYTYTSFKQYVFKQFRWSFIAAKELHKKNHAKRISPFYVLFKTLAKFFETFLLKRGFMDGFHGFIASFGASFFALTKYVCLWELQRNHTDDTNR